MKTKNIGYLSLFFLLIVPIKAAAYDLKLKCKLEPSGLEKLASSSMMEDKAQTFLELKELNFKGVSFQLEALANENGVEYMRLKNQNEGSSFTLNALTPLDQWAVIELRTELGKKKTIAAAGVISARCIAHITNNTVKFDP